MKITAFRVAATGLCLLVAWYFLAAFLAANLIVENPLKRADAIMVMSGSSVYIERTRRAARAYNDGVADKVILTDDGGYAGWSTTERRNPPFVYLAKKELIAQGVPEEDIEVLLPQVTGTIYEARALSERIQNGKIRSVLLVTSAYHSRRAVWTFENEISKDVRIGVVSPDSREPLPGPSAWWLSPGGWRLVAGEYVKFVVYWLFY